MSKKNLILGGILIVLIALAYIYQGPFRNWQTSHSQPKNILANINVDGVTEIDITRNGTTTALVKEGDKWKIGGTKSFYVAAAAADSLDQALKNAVKADVDVVSTNPDKKSEFNTDSSGIQVTLKQGNQDLGSFTVGKLASDFTSTYISDADTDNTYALKENIYYAFAPDSWYDKTIFSGNQDNIAKIRFQYPNSEFTIEKATSTDENGAAVTEWEGTVPYSFRVTKDKADGIAALMANLNAAEIPAQTFDGTGLDQHGIIVEATGPGIDNVLMVGGEKAGSDESNPLYYAKRGDSDNIYLITKDQRDQLETTIRGLK